MAETEVPEARVGDVTFGLSWDLRDGSLRGELEAVNVSDHPVRLSGKPGLTPVGTDGRPLEADTAVTLEMRHPGYVDLEPGQRAKSPVGWGGWDGAPASGRVIVRWEGGEVEVNATGPLQPESHGPATNLYSSWFSRVE